MNRFATWRQAANLLASGRGMLVVVLISSSAAIAAGALGADREPFSHDEFIYFDLLVRFTEPWSWSLLRDYDGVPASPGPVFFVTYGAVGGIFGHSFAVYRFTSLALTCLTVLTVWRFGATRGGERRVSPLLLWLHPYVFAMAFSVMAEPLTMLLTALGLTAYAGAVDRSRDVGRWRLLLLGGVCVTLALHVRIHALIAPVGLLAVLLATRERDWRVWGLALAPLCLRVPLMLYQGGLAVDRTAFEGTKPELGFAPTHLNFFLTWLAINFFVLLPGGGWRLWRAIILIGVLTPIYVLLPPDYLSFGHMGALRTLADRADLSTPMTQVLLYPAWALGVLIASQLARDWLRLGPVPLLADASGAAVRTARRSDGLLAIAALALGAALMVSTAAFERYFQLSLLPLVMLGLAGANPRASHGLVLAATVCFAAASAFDVYRDVAST